MSRETYFLRVPVGDFFPYMGWMCKAWERAGGHVLEDVRLPHKLRAALGRLIGVSLGGNKRRLVVCGSHRIEGCAWPWNYGYEIVPMMWDLWPDNYPAFERFVRRNRVKTVFCSASQSCAWLREHCPGVNVVWVPEAADAGSLPMGVPLAERSIDVLSYGRRVDAWHREILKTENIRYQVGAGSTFAELAQTVRQAKISICVPMVDTRPEKAKGVETLTQRYWEAMFSGTLVVGRAPRELVELCGYNPVVELGDRPTEKIGEILTHLAEYQDLVDRNRQTAERVGDCRARIPLVFKALGRCG